MADFALRRAELEAAGVAVIAASVDDLSDAKKIAEETQFPFAIAYGLDANAIAETLGAFYEPAPDGAYLHPTDFIIAPDGTISSATYSTSPVGRLAPDDALAFINHKKKHASGR